MVPRPARRPPLIVDELRQLDSTDPMTGASLKHNLFVPRSYDSSRRQQKGSLSRENDVKMTKVVHLSGQLSNLRHELRSPFDAL